MLNETVHRNVAGRNGLDFLPPEQHAEALAAGRLICGQPCGIWQLNPVHYEQEYSQIMEATIFPLGPTADGIPLMLGNFEYLTSAERKLGSTERGSAPKPPAHMNSLTSVQAYPRSPIAPRNTPDTTGRADTAAAHSHPEQAQQSRRTAAPG